MLPAGFVIGSGFDFADVTLEQGNTGNCDTATYTSKSVGAAPSGLTWGFGVSGLTLSFTSGTDSIIAGRCVRIVFLDNGVNNQIITPSVSVDQSFVVNLSSASGIDTGRASVVILNDPSTPDGDQIGISANILGTIILDLDTVSGGCANGTEVSVSSVDLGFLYPGMVVTSGPNVNFICVDVGTNLPNGLKVFVRSSRSNLTGGLVAGSNYIESVNGNLNSVSVPSGYGLRISSLGVAEFGSFVPTPPFNSLTPGYVGMVPGALSPPAEIFRSNVSARTGLSNRVALEVSAKSSSSVPQGVYTDILTFTALVSI